MYSLFNGSEQEQIKAQVCCSISHQREAKKHKGQYSPEVSPPGPNSLSYINDYIVVEVLQMRQMRNSDTNTFRTPHEINELNRLLDDASIPKETSKKAKILLHMNVRDNPDGTHVSYKERLRETMSSLNVSESEVKKTLTLYNRAGIQGIMRNNCTVKPDIADRKEDRLPADTQSAEDIISTTSMMDKVLAKMSERTGIDSETLLKLTALAEECGMKFVMDNPTKVQRLWKDELKQAEVAGFWFCKGVGIFSIATKNVELEDGTFIIRHVFKDTEVCGESKDAVDKVFKGNNGTPVDSPVSVQKEAAGFFTDLRRAYPPEGGWRVHSFVLDERAATNPITGEPIIDWLPAIEGYTFEKTVHLCDFTSPIKATFEMAYRRDDTNVQGWKVRDKATALILGASENPKPVVYIGADTEIVDKSVPGIQMYARVSLPGNGSVFIKTDHRAFPIYEKLGSDVSEEFQDAVSQADYVIKDMATKLAGCVFQSTVNAAQAQAAAGRNGTLKPVMAESESGRKRILVSPSIAASIGAKGMLYTNNFMELIVGDVTDESYREAVEKLNRVLHRDEYEELHFTTIQDMVSREGSQILECLERECKEGLEMYQVEFRDGEMVFSNIPENVTNPAILSQAVSGYDWEEIKRNLEKRNKDRDEGDQLTLEQVREALSQMEKDPKKTVYVIFDGVVVKKQKEHRTKRRHFQGFKQKTRSGANKKKGGKSQKKPGAQGQNTAATPEEDNKSTFQTHNTYILFQNKVYVMTAASMEAACRNALGFLLKKGLLEDHELVFFSDGAKDIRAAIKRWFSFRPYHLFLDWFHVEQCLYQYFTMFLKGGKERFEENESIRKAFFNLLWEGKFEEAKEYIKSIDNNIVKSPTAGQSIINYLDKKAECLYAFEIRKLAGLINSSNRVEQINYALVSKRQKKNGMAWCPSGSRAMTAWSMMYMNKGWTIWHETHKVSFEMHDTTVPVIYLPPAEAQAA